MSEYYEKYIKYKNKYINLQSQLGGDGGDSGDSSRRVLPLPEDPEVMKYKAEIVEATAYFSNRYMQDKTAIFEIYVKLRHPNDQEQVDTTWPTTEVFDKRKKYYKLIGEPIDDDTLRNIEENIGTTVSELVEALLRIREIKEMEGNIDDNDNKLINEEKEFLKSNKKFLDKYELFPDTIITDFLDT
jgi:hypothetical protein